MLSDFAVPHGYVPARIEIAPGGRWRSGRFTPAELTALAAHLAERGAPALAAVPLERRLAAWDGAIAALLDPESDERRTLFPALVATARLSPEGLSEGLDVVLGGWRGEAAAELAARVRPTSPAGLAGAILAANVPGLAAQSLLPALLAGRPLLLKSALAEPLFAPALVAALVAREPALADALAAVAFAGEDDAALTAAFGGATRLLAYGGGPAIAALAGRFGGRLLAQGPKASVALVGDGVAPLDVGRALARDVALLDQRGCLSVHAVFVVGDPRELAEALAFGLAIEARRLPPGPAEAEALAAVQQWRGTAALTGSLIGDLATHEGTVVLAPDAGLRFSPGLRAVRVHGVASLEAAATALAPWRGSLQGVALAGAGGAPLAAPLAALGVSRLAAAGELQAADAGWANGGLDPLTLFG